MSDDKAVYRLVCVKQEGEDYYIRSTPDGDCDGTLYETMSPSSMDDTMFWPNPKGPYTLQEVEQWIEDKTAEGADFKEKSG